MPLLVIALFGLTVPNGLFFYWLFTEYHGLGSIVRNRLALAFILDALLAVGLLAYFFSKDPGVRYKWYWFVLFSIIGGLGFSIPFYWWLNGRAGSSARSP